VPDFLDSALASLTETPVPPLADAGTVRGRGDQRRRRTRVAVAGVSAAAVLVTAGTVLAVDRRGRPDSLHVATTPTPTALPATADGAPPLAGALVQPSDAHDLLSGDWSQAAPWGDGTESILRGCSGTPIAGFHGVDSHLDDGHGRLLFAQVLNLGSPDASARAYQALLDDLRRCPRTPEGPPAGPHGEDGPTQFQVHRQGDSAVALAATKVVCSESCTPQTQDWVVAREGTLLGYIQLPGAGVATEWADVLHRRLAACGTGCPPPQQAHPRGFPDEVAPQIGATLWTVLVSYRPEEGPPESASIEDEDTAMVRLRNAGYVRSERLLACQQPTRTGAGWPGTGHAALQVYFPTEKAARQFRDAFVSKAGAPLAKDAGPYEVTIRCLGD
jgi:hypothetical protein